MPAKAMDLDPETPRAYPASGYTAPSPPQQQRRSVLAAVAARADEHVALPRAEAPRVLVALRAVGLGGARHPARRGRQGG